MSDDPFKEVDKARNRTPPPRVVTPDIDGMSDTPSGLHPVLKKDMRRAFRINELLTAAIAVLVGMGTLWVGQYVFVGQARAQGREAAEQAVAEVKAQQAAIDARLTTLEKKTDRADAKTDRQDQQINLALDALRVPKGWRPPPVPPLASIDGGR